MCVCGHRRRDRGDATGGDRSREVNVGPKGQHACRPSVSQKGEGESGHVSESLQYATKALTARDNFGRR